MNKEVPDFQKKVFIFGSGGHDLPTSQLFSILKNGVPLGWCRKPSNGHTVCKMKSPWLSYVDSLGRLHGVLFDDGHAFPIRLDDNQWESIRRLKTTDLAEQIEKGMVAGNRRIFISDFVTTCAPDLYYVTPVLYF